MSELELLVVVGASLLGSFIKSVTGMGYPLIAIPILTFFVGVETAVAVIAIPNTIANAILNFGVREHRHETRDLPVLVVASILGAIVGTLVLVEAPEKPLLLGLAATILAFVVQRFRSPEMKLDAATSKRGAPVAGLIAGFSQGAVGVSGPIVAMWLHGYRLPKNAYVFSVTALFLTSGAAQLAILVGAGMYDRDRLVASALALVATLSMIPVGTRLRGRIGGASFERWIVVLLGVSCISLVARALSL